MARLVYPDQSATAASPWPADQLDWPGLSVIGDSDNPLASQLLGWLGLSVIGDSSKPLPGLAWSVIHW
jgi:hypothetical protein